MNNYYYMCYEPIDSAYFAEKLCAALASKAEIPKPLINPENLPLIDDYQEFIGQTIRNSAGLVFMMTPKSVDSDVCRKEWRYALKNLKPIIPVRFDAYTNPPIALDSLSPIDFSSDFDAGIKNFIDRSNWFSSDEGIRKTIELAILDARFELRRPGTDKILLSNRIEKYQLLISNLELKGSLGQAINLLTKHIFISYSRQDSDAMKDLKRILTRYGVPIWYDDKVEQGTENWPKEIQSAIEKAGCVVCILSPDAKNSEWVSQEIHYAKLHDIQIFPLLIRGDDKNAVPIELANYQRTNVNLNESLEKQLDNFISHITAHLQKQKIEFSY